MNTLKVVGIILLILAAVYFFFAPAYRITNGTEEVLWANILPGIALAVVGIVLLAAGFRGKKEST